MHHSGFRIMTTAELPQVSLHVETLGPGNLLLSAPFRERRFAPLPERSRKKRYETTFKRLRGKQITIQKIYDNILKQNLYFTPSLDTSGPRAWKQIG